MDRNWLPKDFKIIRDSVHSDIIVEDRYLKIINTREFQRLRRIKQLSVANIVFPSADHTRFSHSIGTFYVMKKIIAQISEQFQTLGFEIDERDKEIAIVSALVHDIGHGPFSHAFENLLRTSTKDHEEWGADIIKSKKTQINRVMRKIFDEKFPDEVVNILSKKDPKMGTEKQIMFFDVLSSLISSQIDADRLDYLVRDSNNTGVKFGNIDLDRIISAINITVQDHKYCVYIPEKYLVDIEEYLFSRYQMNKSVYFHPTKVELEEIIRLIFKRAYELNSTKKLEYMPDVLKKAMTDQLVVTEYCQLDETILVNTFHEWSVGKDKILARLCCAYLNRDKFQKLKILDGSLVNIEKFKFDLMRILKQRQVDLITLDNSYFWIQKEISFTMYKSKKENIRILNKLGKLEDFSEISKVFSKDINSNINEYHGNFTYINLDILKYSNKKVTDNTISEIEELINRYDTRSHIEIEYKYLLKEHTFDEITNYLAKTYFKDFTIGMIKEQKDTYYDTMAHEFYNAGETLRIRNVDGKYFFTIKTPISDNKRDIIFNQNERFEFEHQIEINEIESCKEFIKDKTATMIDIENQFILPLLVIKNNRQKNILKYKDALLEISYDDFTIIEIQGDKYQEIGKEKQIEIELKSEYSKKIVLDNFCELFTQNFNKLILTTDSKLKIGMNTSKKQSIST